MHDWQSLSHVRWECKYHVIIIPKYRHKVFYGKMRGRIARVANDKSICWRDIVWRITFTCA